MKLAPQIIEALAQVISGGSGNDATPSIGVYRSGPRLESFMRACGVSMSVGNGPRLPALIAALEDVNRREDEKVLREIIERAADPRDFVTKPDEHVAVVPYLNEFLRYDDL